MGTSGRRAAAGRVGAGGTWLRTNGVDTNRAAPKVMMNSDRLGENKFALALLGRKQIG